MKLRVEYNSGIYEIKGLLNCKNSVYLEYYLNRLMANTRGVVLSLENLLGIDHDAVQRMVVIQQKAMQDQQLFFIIGRKNKNIIDQFTALQYGDVLL